MLTQTGFFRTREIFGPIYPIVGFSMQGEKSAWIIANFGAAAFQYDFRTSLQKEPREVIRIGDRLP